MMLSHLTVLAFGVTVGRASPQEARVDLCAAADSSPVLTADALPRLTNFGASFKKEPDSIKTKMTDTAYAHRRQMTIGTLQFTVTEVDMVAVAAKYPSVAADIKRSGLTVQQIQAYMRALVEAMIYVEAGTEAGTVTPGSVLEKNIAFVRAHRQAINAIAEEDTTSEDP